jgi:hypothetical protein
MVDPKAKDYHPLYVSFYLLYQFSLIILLNSVFLDFDYPTEAITGLHLLYTILLFFWKPYALNIHNYVNFFNQAVVILFLVFSVLGKHKLLNDSIKILNLYATITLIVVALVLQLIRIYVYKKSLGRSFRVDKKDLKEKIEDSQKINIHNQYISCNKFISQNNKIGFELRRLMA